MIKVRKQSSLLVLGLDLLLDSLHDVLHFLGLPVVLAQVVGEHAVGLRHGVESAHAVSSLETDQAPGVLRLGGGGVVQAELHFEEHEHAAQVLVAFHVDHVLQVACVRVVALHFFEVFVQDELHPDLTDFRKNRFRLRDLSFFLKEFSKIIIAGA